MYGLVLAAAMTAGATSPDLHFRSHGCCGYTCCGYSCCGYSCCGCCGGYGFASYYGCSGCYGCYGCYGCGGCCGWGGYYGGYLAVVPAPIYVAPAYYPGCYGYAMSTPTYAPSHGTPVPQMLPADQTSKMAPATVVIKTGEGVTVTVDGVATTLTAKETTFQTPVLDGSKSYTYVFEASKKGTTETETQTVKVSAGKKTIVDFSTFGAVADKELTNTAKVTVILPGEGKLFVNDVQMSIKGKQTFETPKLTPGQRYFYTVKADLVKDGKTTSETRRVSIAAGKSITVDFTSVEVVSATH